MDEIFDETFKSKKKILLTKVSQYALWKLVNLHGDEITEPNLIKSKKKSTYDGVAFCINDFTSTQIFVTLKTLLLEKFTLPTISNVKFGLTIRVLSNHRNHYFLFLILFKIFSGNVGYNFAFPLLLC